jgi:hypothetical protein
VDERVRRCLRAVGVARRVPQWAQGLLEELRTGQLPSQSPAIALQLGVPAGHASGTEARAAAGAGVTTISALASDPAACPPPRPALVASAGALRAAPCLLDADACRAVVQRIRESEFGVGLDTDAASAAVIARQHARLTRALTRLAQDL